MCSEPGAGPGPGATRLPRGAGVRRALHRPHRSELRAEPGAPAGAAQGAPGRDRPGTPRTAGRLRPGPAATCAPRGQVTQPADRCAPREQVTRPPAHGAAEPGAPHPSPPPPPAAAWGAEPPPPHRAPPRAQQRPPLPHRPPRRVLPLPPARSARCSGRSGTRGRAARRPDPSPPPARLTPLGAGPGAAPRPRPGSAAPSGSSGSAAPSGAAHVTAPRAPIGCGCRATRARPFPAPESALRQLRTGRRAALRRLRSAADPAVSCRPAQPYGIGVGRLGPPGSPPAAAAPRAAGAVSAAAWGAALPLGALRGRAGQERPSRTWKRRLRRAPPSGRCALRTLRNVVSAGAAPEGSRCANGVGASVPGAGCAALRARARQVCEGRAGPAPAVLGAPGGPRQCGGTSPVATPVPATSVNSSGSPSPAGWGGRRAGPGAGLRGGGQGRGAAGPRPLRQRATLVGLISRCQIQNSAERAGS